ncbi:AbiJ-NTD4 domain-containing protein [Chitinophaga flava]|uniref:HEPN AbiJ-N-terminal domain-containing protein n=1 Tax=Chitinophaga flava TaxID=2259036 RepID=A0A365Y4A4_9BACT|nr:hypothetical protein [Chitinophaga flava]RBL93340.1 hypothetical protein DF182_12505 [Chitinophaga flava]
MKFSERIGITQSQKELQLTTLDDDLKNGLWNIYNVCIYNLISGSNHGSNSLSGIGELFANHLWHNFFKLTIDSAPSDYYKLYYSLKKRFYEGEWYETFDLIQESYSYLVGINFFKVPQNVENSFNEILEREFSGYRFIQGIIAPITNKHEISELNNAIENTEIFSTLNGCNIHLRSALEKLSDKITPDYRNSIKESISAVESICKVISTRPKDTLNSAIDRIKGKIKIHAQLEQGFKNIYNYTSDEGGVRHGMMDTPSCDFEDAKFMLISCSAFINYLIVKANKAGINFQ